MFSHPSQPRFLDLLSGIALALCLVAGPVHAKSHAAPKSGDNGGLFQAPSPVAKPGIVLDTTIPPALTAKSDKARPDSPIPVAAVPTASVIPAVSITPPQSAESSKRIENMRLHSLFE